MAQRDSARDIQRVCCCHSRCHTSSLTRMGQAVNVLSADFADSLGSLREILLKEWELALLVRYKLGGAERDKFAYANGTRQKS